MVAERARVYELVLTEGTAADVAHFVDADELLKLRDQLVLPARVRPAWADWYRHR